MEETLKGSALILVDIQNDFLPGGALPVPRGDEILEGVSKLLERRHFKTVVATQDWHPPGHVSFASSHEGGKVFEKIILHGKEQVLWPDHCVQGSGGADIHDSLPREPIKLILRKGYDKDVDSYSAFRSAFGPEGKRRPTGLEGYLSSLGTEKIFVCGLARDYCVKWTAEDASEIGFETYFIWDLTMPVDGNSDDIVRSDLRSRGIRIINAGDI